MRLRRVFVFYVPEWIGYLWLAFLALDILVAVGKLIGPASPEATPIAVVKAVDNTTDHQPEMRSR